MFGSLPAAYWISKTRLLLSTATWPGAVPLARLCHGSRGIDANQVIIVIADVELAVLVGQASETASDQNRPVRRGARSEAVALDTVATTPVGVRSVGRNRLNGIAEARVELL